MTKDDILTNSDFRNFVNQVREHLQQLQPNEVDVRADLEREHSELNEQCRGWKQSLGDPTLAESLRHELQNDWERGHARMDDIQENLQALASHTQTVNEIVKPELVADHVLRLSDTLSGENASAMNVLLSQHIDGIYCDQDGEIQLRTSKLGVIPDAIELVPRAEGAKNQIASGDSADEQTSLRAEPRRRTRRNLSDTVEDDDLAMALNEFAVDPARFEGLGSEWFSVTEFRIPTTPSWREKNARAIAEWRIENAATMVETVERFGKSAPTIRAALREAKEKYGIDATGKEIGVSKRSCWSVEHALEVAEFLQSPGATIKQAAEHFGKSEPTISKAKRLASTLDQ